jgi:Integrase core domain
MAKLACLNFLTRYKAQNSNYQILLNLVNVNTKYAYVVALKDKTQDTVLNALERIRQRSTIDGRPLKVLKIDNGKEFTNNKITNWLSRHQLNHNIARRMIKNVLEYVSIVLLN